MIWRYALAAVVAFALLGAAASLWLHEPAGADDVYRHAVVCRAVCK